MTSKVDTPLHMQQHGTEVTVTGPISSWDSDEEYAIFTVVVSQVEPDGTVVNAMGVSARCARTATSWQATARVTDPGVHLTAGPAKAFAVAAIATSGGDSEAYPWNNDINLVPAVVAAGTRN